MLGIDNMLQDAPRVRAGDSKLCPAVGRRNQLHIHVGEQALAHKFHVLVDLGRIGRGGSDDEMIFCQPPGRATLCVSCAFHFCSFSQLVHVIFFYFHIRPIYIDT